MTHVRTPFSFQTHPQLFPAHQYFDYYLRIGDQIGTMIRNNDVVSTQLHNPQIVTHNIQYYYIFFLKLTYRL
jgi:hypothetical protein